MFFLIINSDSYWIVQHRWLYALFLAIDANFRLKRKTVSNDVADPSLNRGTAAFVEESAYKEYLAGYDYQEEVVSYFNLTIFARC